MFRLIVNGSDREFIFRSHDEQITNEWITQIKKQIEQSEGGKSTSNGQVDTKT